MKYVLRTYYKIKYNDKEYDWPCQSNPDRKVRLYDSDILTVSEKIDNMCKVIKHTGICFINILVPEEDLIKIDEKITLGIY